MGLNPGEDPAKDGPLGQVMSISHDQMALTEKENKAKMTDRSGSEPAALTAAKQAALAITKSQATIKEATAVETE